MILEVLFAHSFIHTCSLISMHHNKKKKDFPTKKFLFYLLFPSRVQVINGQTARQGEINQSLLKICMLRKAAGQ